MTKNYPESSSSEESNISLRGTHDTCCMPRDHYPMLCHNRPPSLQFMAIIRPPHCRVGRVTETNTGDRRQACGSFHVQACTHRTESKRKASQVVALGASALSHLCHIPSMTWGSLCCCALPSNCISGSGWDARLDPQVHITVIRNIHQPAKPRARCVGARD